MAKQILRNTESIAAVKVWGAGSTETIDLQTDLIIPNRVVLDGATQTVNIMSFSWSGIAGSSIKVVRGGVDIMTVDGGAATELIFDNMLFTDSVQNTADIVVTVTGDCYLYMVLRKQGGYAQTFQPGPFSIRDNPNIVDTPVNPNP